MAKAETHSLAIDLSVEHSEWGIEQTPLAFDKKGSQIKTHNSQGESSLLLSSE